MDTKALGTHLKNRVTLHTILIGVAGTIHDPYIIDALCKLDSIEDEAPKVATKRNYHAVQNLKKGPTPNMPSKLAMGDWGRGATGQAAYRRARCKPGRMANNSPDPH
eukprot:847662-Pelagomonas_calceolata.AAC.1